MAKHTATGITVAAEIAGFIKCQLLTGRYTVGEKLPTAGDLARRFDVDPNTARAAYARLKAEGLVESTRGKGTFVSADIQQRQSSRLGELVQDAIREAHSLGLSTEDLATVIWLQKRFSAGRPRVWYVDNDFPYFEAIRHRIEELTGSDALGCELNGLKDRIDEGAGPTDGDLVITSKYNSKKVAESLDEPGPVVVPISPRFSPDTIERLSELDPELTLGVVCVDKLFADISGKVIERSGISVPQVRGNSKDLSTLPSVFSDADAITISTVALSRLKAARVDLPDKPIVPFHYELTEDCEIAVMNGAETVLGRLHAAGAWPGS